MPVLVKKGNGKGNGKGGGKPRLLPIAPGPEVAEMKAGKYVQYVRKGPGFLPVADTIDRLPAGAYRIRQMGMADGDTVMAPAEVVTDELVWVPDGQSDEVIREIRDFWRQKPDYARLGYSHKRGYLLHGPPGSGKSCTVAAVMRDVVENDGIVLFVTRPELVDSMLQRFRSVEPDRPLLVVWEDIDAYVGHSHIEAQGLAFLDGDAQVSNVVFMATTNYPEKLDKRLVNRPGRFDRVVKIGLPNAEARRMYLEAKLGTTVAPDGRDLLDLTHGLSFAHLRELVVGIRIQGKGALEVAERLKAMKVVPKSSAGSGGIGFGGEEGIAG